MKHLLASNALPLLLLVSAILLIQTPTTTFAQNSTFISLLNCPSTSENFLIGSQYQSNLLTLLPALVTNGSSDFFSLIFSGSDPDKVYGLAQCRNDVTLTDCASCLATARLLITQNCVNKKAAIIRFNYCMLRYSNLNFFSQMDSLTTDSWYWNDVTITDLAGFNLVLGKLVANLTLVASSSQFKYAQGWESFTDGSNLIYGLAQCTQDLSSIDCTSCLQTMFNIVPTCCSGKPGGWVLSPSCQIWYRKGFQFFTSLPTPSPPPSK